MKTGRVLLIAWFVMAIVLSVISPNWWSGLILGVASMLLFFDLGGSFVTRRYQKERLRNARKENVL